MDGPLFKAVEASNAGRFDLLRGQDSSTGGVLMGLSTWSYMVIQRHTWIPFLLDLRMLFQIFNDLRLFAGQWCGHRGNQESLGHSVASLHLQDCSMHCSTRLKICVQLHGQGIQFVHFLTAPCLHPYARDASKVEKCWELGRGLRLQSVPISPGRGSIVGGVQWQLFYSFFWSHNLPTKNRQIYHQFHDDMLERYSEVGIHKVFAFVVCMPLVLQRLQAPTAAEIPRLEENVGESRDNSESLSLRSKENPRQIVRICANQYLMTYELWGFPRNSHCSARRIASKGCEKPHLRKAPNWSGGLPWNGVLSEVSTLFCTDIVQDHGIFRFSACSDLPRKICNLAKVLLFWFSSTVRQYDAVALPHALLRLSLVMQQVVEILAEYVSCMQHDATSDSNVLHCSAVEGSIIIQNFDIIYWSVSFDSFITQYFVALPFQLRSSKTWKGSKKCIACYLIGIWSRCLAMLPGDRNEAPHRILRKGQLLCSSSQCWHCGALQVELASLLPSLALATGREGWQGGYLCRLGRGSFPESRMLGTLQTFCRMLGFRRRTAGGCSCTLCSRCQHCNGPADAWPENVTLTFWSFLKVRTSSSDLEKQTSMHSDADLPT